MSSERRPHVQAAAEGAPPSPRRNAARAALALLLAGGAAALLAACPGSLENKEDFSGAPADILAQRCATANCHDSKFKAGFLDLTPDAGLRSRIVNVPSKGIGCNAKLADTAAPEMSLIYTKCTSTPPCGTQMPQTGASLTQDELDELLMWLETLK